MEENTKVGNTYYIGHISCDTKNAMMKEIADFINDYEYTLLHAEASEFFNSAKASIDDICAKHKRCKPVQLQMSTGFFCVNIYARKPGSDTSIISITLNEVLRVLKIK